MSTGLAKIDLRLQRLEESICPVTMDTLDEVCEQIVLTTAENVIELDARLLSREYRKSLVGQYYVLLKIRL